MAKTPEEMRAYKAEYARKWRKANPERNAEANRKSNEKRKENGYFRQYHVENREQRLATSRAWRLDHPEVYREISAKRRALARGSDVGAVSYLDIGERDNWTCALCSTAVDKSLSYPSPDSGSIDHIIPVARGGSHNNDNLQLAHLRCNWSKGAKVGD